jgi:GNAT superfamily N-acetyltransferase
VEVLEVRVVSGYDELQRWVEARSDAGPDAYTTEMTALLRAVELDHVDLLALEDGEAVGTAFISGDPRSIASGCPYVEINVPPDRRGRGIGSALFEAVVEHARGLGHHGLRCTALADDEYSVAYLRRRGLEVRRRTHQLMLELGDVVPPLAPQPAAVAWLASRPELLSGMYRVAREGAESRPDFSVGFVRTQSDWQMYELGSPLVRLDVTAVAHVGDEVVGYAIGQDLPQGDGLYHRAMAIAPGWQDRGIAEALVRAQALRAHEAGIRLLMALPWSEPLEGIYLRLGYMRGAEWLELEGSLD